MRLVAASDDHFRWMLEGDGLCDGLRLPPGGVDHPAILKYLRRVAADLRNRSGGGSWLVVERDEVAGLCSHKHAPTPGGDVEIGYGIVEACRSQNIATTAVAGMLELAARDEEIVRFIAETASDNLPSQRVLEKNGFVRTGTRVDPEDGGLILWDRLIRI
jgi:RimJ/RimL family protein N-acetyltransferase